MTPQQMYYFVYALLVLAIANICLIYFVAHLLDIQEDLNKKIREILK